MIKKIDIADIGVVDSIRSNMSLATRIDNGLLSNTMFSMFMDGSMPVKKMSDLTDINNLHMECNAGFTFYMMASSAINSPGGGILLHFQRLAKGSTIVGSFLVSQLCMLMTGELMYRTGNSFSDNIVYSQWREM